MPPLYTSEADEPIKTYAGWRWSTKDGHVLTVSVENQALRLRIVGKPGSKISWSLPVTTNGDWLVPDGEGIVMNVVDPFWRAVYRRGRCLDASSALSFPAWSLNSNDKAIVYALGDGLQSKVCFHDRDGLQAKLLHEFSTGAETLEILIAVRPDQPLAPAFFYRQLLKARGQSKSFSDKKVSGLPQLFAAPQAYIWGDGRSLGFLNDLRALGIRRIVLSYDQDARHRQHLVGPTYLRRARALGYLAGPYDEFDNGQPQATADTPTSIWGDLYPSGCIRTADGEIQPAAADRGCDLSSEAQARHPDAPSPASRFKSHVDQGANQVFLDVDAYGHFEADFSPDHPMTMAQDRANRLARMSLAIDRFGLILGSENVNAWSSPVVHYSHGTAQAHVDAVWPLLKDEQRFGGFWPADRPAIFFKPLTPTSDEARLLFGAADRIPLFEAVFHDSVVAADRWEFSLTKVIGQERNRFARAILYGTPTMWNLDRRELARSGIWLKAAADAFILAHGTSQPVALTAFEWLTPDRLVQRVSYADGRVLTGNFGDAAWNGLGPDCVRLNSSRHTADICPPSASPTQP